VGRREGVAKFKNVCVLIKRIQDLKDIENKSTYFEKNLLA